ncbi:MAG: UvrB/UvrC motif-containing protein [Gemmatimonadetes bacterium]|nr:UvrB/UvrC motif-containing protein [Gemmatimonadota bacterium]
MLCEHCRERDAVVHLTQIVDNAVTTTHLCEPCAAAKGVETGAGVAKFPLGDFLATLGKSGPAEQAEAGSDIPCRFCGATLRDFRQSGRLGCARCYASFDAHLRDLLRRLHGSSQHVGEMYRLSSAAAPAESETQRRLGDLREQLRRAVDAENFELAAELRDRIRVLE